MSSYRKITFAISSPDEFLVYHVNQKTSVYFFAITLSDQALFWQFLAHLSKFPIASVFALSIKSKTENQLKFKKHNALRLQSCACMHIAQPSSCFVARRQASSRHPTCGFLTYLTSVLLITESWICYRSGSVNIMCDMLKSWLTDRRSLIKRLIGGDRLRA